MFRKPALISLWLIIPLVWLIGCTMTTPTCDPGNLEAPELLSPDWREVMSGSAVVLEWAYPSTDCQPESYEVILSKERDYAVLEITEDTGNPDTTWSPSSALDPAEEYFWRVAAKVGTTKSDYSHERRSFFTEPVCDSSDLVAPSLTLPPNGGIFERNVDSLEWEWPLSSCIPESYRVELSPTADFSDTSLFGATGTPGTRWGPGSPLDPATQYWWRIYGFVGTTLGPPSATWTFVTDPVCDSASLVAPYLSTPGSWEILTTTTPEFSWTYPDPNCTPEGFHLQVATDPDMIDMVLDANNPTTASSSFQAGAPLDDCQSYFFRVAVVADGMEGPFTDVRRFTIDTGTCACDPGSIPQPSLVWPDYFEIVPGNSPTLEWSNPGDCDPEGYTVRLSPIHDLSDSSLFGGTGDASTTWAPGSPLDPATQYWWEVAGMVGPDSGPASSKRSFFTGPECNYVGTTGAPQLLAPIDGDVISTLLPYLRYRAGDCIPDGYLVNLQTDPELGGTNLLTEYDMPSTTVLLTDPLTDCTRYYWQVTPVQDGSYGQLSTLEWFFTNQSGACALPGLPGFFRRNAFCRSGTYPEHFPALHTFLEGGYVEADARNPSSSYLLVRVPGPNSPIPPESYKTCWVPRDYVELWGNVEDLPVENPPPKPEAEQETLTCREDLSQEDCEAAGGVWTMPVTGGNYYCQCP